MTAGHSIHLKGLQFLVFPKPLGVIVYNLFTSRQLCLSLTWVFSGKTLFQNHCYTKEISPWQPEGTHTVIGTTKKKKKKTISAKPINTPKSLTSFFYCHS